MQALQRSEPISIADYLAGEALSEVRHEFIGGAIYAMPGASEDHNIVAGLEEYVLAAQDTMEVTIFRRANQWQPEILRQPEQPLRLASLEFSLQLNTVYERVKV